MQGLCIKFKIHIFDILKIKINQNRRNQNTILNMDYNKKYQQIYEKVSNENKRLSHEQVRVLTNQKFGLACYEEGKRNATKVKEVMPYMNSPIWLDYAANLNNICDNLHITFGELCTLSR